MPESFNRFFKHIIFSNRIFSSLESRSYRQYFIGQGISLIGSWMQTIAMGWLVYTLTGSIFLLGFVGFTNQIPSFILSPFAGVITDRFSRHKIMLWAQVIFMFQALAISLLVLTDMVAIWHIIVLSLIFGFTSAFDAPARQSLVVDLIDDPKKLGNAIALNSALFNGARLVGPAIAGIVIAIFGEGICFLINAMSYLAIIYVLYKGIPVQKDFNTQKNSLKQELTAGLKYTFGFKPIRTLLIMLAVLSLIGTPFTTLMPAFAREILKGGSHVYGFLVSATGAGAFLGAIYLASRKTVLGLGRIIKYNAYLFGVALMGIAFSNYLWLAMLVGFIAGFSIISAIASINTLIQTLADDDKRGRVMSFYAMALMGMNPIGNLLAGSVASGIGISCTFALCGVIIVIAGGWFAFYWPGLGKAVYRIYLERGIINKD
jgi:MFS family permease